MTRESVDRLFEAQAGFFMVLAAEVALCSTVGAKRRRSILPSLLTDIPKLKASLKSSCQHNIDNSLLIVPGRCVFRPFGNMYPYVVY